MSSSVAPAGPSNKAFDNVGLDNVGLDNVGMIESALSSNNPKGGSKPSASTDAGENAGAEAKAGAEADKDTTEPFETLAYTPYTFRTADDYIFQFFVGSVSVVGLFVLFRIIQRSK